MVYPYVSPKIGILVWSNGDTDMIDGDGLTLWPIWKEYDIIEHQKPGKFLPLLGAQQGIGAEQRILLQKLRLWLPHSIPYLGL